MRTRATELSWGVVDQGLSSATNFTLTLFAARILAPHDFGGFALGFAGYLTFLGLARAVASEPLSVRYSAVEQEEWRIASAKSTGAAGAIGFVGAALMALAGILWSGPAGRSLLAIAPFLPGLLLQDAWRFAFFARGRGADAATNDAVWAVLLGVGVVSLMISESPEAWHFTFIWGASGSLAGLAGIAQANVVPLPTQLRTWIREHQDLIPRFSGEFATYFSSGQLALYVIAGVAGLSAVGAIRAAQLLLGPLNVVFMGSGLFAVPEAARSARREPLSVLSVGVRLSVGLIAAVAAWSALVALVPSSLGVGVLGNAWTEGRELLLPISLAMVAAGGIAGAATMLRGLADARRSLSAHVLNGVMTLMLSMLGASLGGPAGAAWGLALAGCCAAANWWRAALASLRAAAAASRLAADTGESVLPPLESADRSRP
jgi:hypothetical protein